MILCWRHSPLRQYTSIFFIHVFRKYSFFFFISNNFFCSKYSALNTYFSLDHQIMCTNKQIYVYLKIVDESQLFLARCFIKIIRKLNNEFWQLSRVRRWIWYDYLHCFITHKVVWLKISIDYPFCKSLFIYICEIKISSYK
jgi:hypothetical protein